MDKVLLLLYFHYRALLQPAGQGNTRKEGIWFDFSWPDKLRLSSISKTVAGSPVPLCEVSLILSMTEKGRHAHLIRLRE